MTKKIRLDGIAKESCFSYPRLDSGDEPGITPRIWYGHCMLGYKEGRLRLMSGVKIEEVMDVGSFGDKTPTSFSPQDPDLPKAVFSLITGINPKYLDPKRFKEIKSGKCNCRYPVRIHLDDLTGNWDRFVCARCLKLVKKNGE